MKWSDLVHALLVYNIVYWCFAYLAKYTVLVIEKKGKIGWDQAFYVGFSIALAILLWNVI